MHHITQTTLYILLLLGASVYCFIVGFLLTRSELNVATSSESIKLSQHWQKKKFDQIVAVCIDGLRYDMADPTADVPPTHNYRGKLPLVKSLLSEHPSKASFNRFVADAPTATMQRLQGITTGSLPTFIDVGSSFNTNFLAEDNWLDILDKHNRSFVEVGDDTWTHLFLPTQLRRFITAPSLDVFDIYTVDNLAMANRNAELLRQNGDWDVLVIHYLGLDHAGHRDCVNSAAIGNRATLYNGEMKDILQTMPQNSLFLMFGDHGMTETGDHGGSSPIEVDSALLMYSQDMDLFSLDSDVRDFVRSLRMVDGEPYPRIPQIDFVPTVTYVLGLEIPFASIGRIIPEIPFGIGRKSFDEKTKFAEKLSYRPSRQAHGGSGKATENEEVDLIELAGHLELALDDGLVARTLSNFGFGSLFDNRPFDKLSALSSKSGNSLELVRGLGALLESLIINAEQVQRYLDTYTLQARPLPIHNLTLLYSFATQSVLPALDSHYAQKPQAMFAAIYLLDSYLRAVQEMCRREWAEFDTFAMITGIAAILSTVAAIGSLVAHLIVTRHFFWPRRVTIVGAVLGAGLWALVSPNMATAHLAGMVATCSALMYVAAVLRKLWLAKEKEERGGDKKTTTLSNVPSTQVRVHVSSMKTVRTVVIVLALLVRLHSLFSNSFILQEDLMTSFCLGTVLLAQAHSVWAVTHHPHNAPVSRFNVWLCVIVAAVCTRLNHVGIRARSLAKHEEAAPVNRGAMDPLISTICFVVLCVVAWALEKHTASLQKDRSHFDSKYGPKKSSNPSSGKIQIRLMIAGIILSFAFWAVQKEGHAETIKDYTWDMSLAHAVYVFSVLGAIVLQPPSAYFRALALFPTMFILSGSQNMVPMTVMLVHAVCVIAIEMYLVHVDLVLAHVIDGNAVPVKLLVDMDAEEAPRSVAPSFIRSRTQSHVTRPSLHVHYAALTLPAVLTWSLLALAYFFATGHQCIFSTIDWNAAFVGFKGYVVPWSGIPLVLAEFSGPILFALSVISIPTLLLPKSPNRDDRSVNIASLVAGWSYVGLWVMYLLMTCTFVWWERRHLMMTAIFAPKFVFDVLFMFIAVLFVFLHFCLGRKE